MGYNRIKTSSTQRGYKYDKQSFYVGYPGAAGDEHVVRHGPPRGEPQGQFAATPYVRFDRALWDRFLQKLLAAGTNTIILDIADALAMAKNTFEAL